MVPLFGVFYDTEEITPTFAQSILSFFLVWCNTLARTQNNNNPPIKRNSISCGKGWKHYSLSNTKRESLESSFYTNMPKLKLPNCCYMSRNFFKIWHKQVTSHGGAKMDRTNNLTSSIIIFFPSWIWIILDTQ